MPVIKYLKIGEFARLGRVSIKALRFYASEGLLQPDHVDPQSGYRYYRVEQCDRLSLITNLRSAGFSIKEIAATIDAGTNLDAILELAGKKRAALAQERAELDNRLAVLETLTKSLQSDRISPLSSVRLMPVPAERVHSIAARVPQLGDAVAELFEKAERDVAAVEARSPNAPFLIFHDPATQQSELAIEVCIPITDESAGRIDNTLIAGCDSGCSLIYSGDYSQTQPLSASMIDWTERVGLAATGPIREVYHRFGADQVDYELPAAVTTTSSDEFITELLLPVAPA